MTLSLSLAIRDALSGGEGLDKSIEAVKMEVRTGSIDVGDEITPLRHVSNAFFSIAVVLFLNFTLLPLYLIDR